MAGAKYENDLVQGENVPCTNRSNTSKGGSLSLFLSKFYGQKMSTNLSLIYIFFFLQHLDKSEWF